LQQQVPFRSDIWILRAMIRKKTKHYSNTTRIPLLLLFRLSGVLLLRFAQRTLFGSLFQEPPRKTREEPELPVHPLQPGAQKAAQLIELLRSIA